MPSSGKPLVIYNDASKVELGAILIKNMKLVAYASQQLKDHNKNYPTQDLDKATVIFALKIPLWYKMRDRYTL